jgi:transcriptional regulator with XRE-family HTH domain
MQQQNGRGAARRIRDQRVARGWSQEEAAARAGVSIGAWRSTESGRRRPRSNTFSAILRVLDLSVEDVRGDGGLWTTEDVEGEREELARLCLEELPASDISAVLRVMRSLTERVHASR